jgi:hypothetical protein
MFAGLPWWELIKLFAVVLLLKVGFWGVRQLLASWRNLGAFLAFGFCVCNAQAVPYVLDVSVTNQSHSESVDAVVTFSTGEVYPLGIVYPGAEISMRCEAGVQGSALAGQLSNAADPGGSWAPAFAIDVASYGFAPLGAVYAFKFGVDELAKRFEALGWILVALVLVRLYYLSWRS